MQFWKTRLFQRTVVPSVLAVGGMFFFTRLYNSSVDFFSRPLLNDLLLWSGLLGMVFCVFVSPLIIYIYTFSRGAGFTERFFASMAAPIIKSFLVLSTFFGIYSTGEVLFLLIHHCVIGPVVFGITEVGIGSLICHGLQRKRTKDRSIRVFRRGETVCLFAGTGLFILFLWDFGHFYYYTFLDLYISLFLGGSV